MKTDPNLVVVAVASPLMFLTRLAYTAARLGVKSAFTPEMIHPQAEIHDWHSRNLAEYPQALPISETPYSSLGSR